MQLPLLFNKQSTHHSSKARQSRDCNGLVSSCLVMTSFILYKYSNRVHSYLWLAAVPGLFRDSLLLQALLLFQLCPLPVQPAMLLVLLSRLLHYKHITLTLFNSLIACMASITVRHASTWLCCSALLLCVLCRSSRSLQLVTTPTPYLRCIQLTHYSNCVH